jgi:hypothetical protein
MSEDSPLIEARKNLSSVVYLGPAHGILISLPMASAATAVRLLQEVRENDPARIRAEAKKRRERFIKFSFNGLFLCGHSNPVPK